MTERVDYESTSWVLVESSFEEMGTEGSAVKVAIFKPEAKVIIPVLSCI